MDLIAGILLFVIATSITPGPNNIIIMSTAANFGIRRSIPLLMGICLGFPVMVLAIGLGLGSFFHAFPQALTVMNYLGISYLFYLAYTVAKNAPQCIDKYDHKPIGFIQAALMQWLNPKAWTMATGAVTTYVTNHNQAYMQVLSIALLFFIVSLPSVGVWLFFGGSMRGFLGCPYKQRIFNYCMSGLLVLSLMPTITHVAL